MATVMCYCIIKLLECDELHCATSVDLGSVDLGSEVFGSRESWFNTALGLEGYTYITCLKTINYTSWNYTFNHAGENRLN